MGEWADDEGPWDDVGAYSTPPGLCVSCKQPLTAHSGFSCPEPAFFPEEAHAELLAAGWKKYGSFTAYQAPDGRIFRGPYTAWRVLKGFPHLGGEK